MAPSAAVEKDLRRGDFIFRYVEKDDFGEPENAFLVCTFWYVNALAALDRRDEARALFEKLLACRNRHGLLAEHIDPRSWRTMGQLRADLQHGGVDQRRNPLSRALGPGVLSAPHRRANCGTRRKPGVIYTVRL
jgi:hypothetical protein